MKNNSQHSIYINQNIVNIAVYVTNYLLATKIKMSYRFILITKQIAITKSFFRYDDYGKTYLGKGI